MTTVKKIDGAPGAGKTTSIFNRIEELADDGVPPEDVLVVTFTRTARADAESELIDVYPGSDRRDVEKRVRTFHGAALASCRSAGLVEDPGEQIIVPDEHPETYTDFCRQNALPFNKNEPSSWDDIRGDDVDELPAGNRLIKLADWLSLTQRPAEDCPHAPVKPNFGFEKTVSLLERWDDFKQEGTTFENDDGERVNEPYFEHTDYVDAAIEDGLVPRGEYLFIDEFQDLSPQEYRLFREWRESGAFDTIVCAGDPEQSIYGFREATPYFFEEMPVDDVETRKLTYRVPENITAVASGILDDHPETDPRGFSAESDGGTVAETSITSSIDFRELVTDAIEAHGSIGGPADVYILARANHQVHTISRYLDAVGLPYRQLGQSHQAWTDTISGVFAALRAINDGRPVTATAAKALIDQLPDGRDRAAEIFGGTPLWGELDADDLIGADDMRRGISEPPVAIVDRLGDISPKRRELLANAFERRDIADHHPADLHIGTIHSAKGLEANCVILCPEITPRIERAYYDDTATAAEEHRLFYVGVTRAREGLVILRDFVRGPVFPGLRDKIPGVKR